MEYKKTQVDGLELSRVGLGTWAIGGGDWGDTNVEEAVQTIRKALDMGITVVDTAPVYGQGHSEEVVGKALSEGGYRNKAVLATKCGLSWDAEGNVYRDCRPETIRREVELSLKRLRTDHIDLYQIHWADIKVPFAETAGTMMELIKEGKIRAIGVSNMSNAQMDEWRKTAPIHTLQPSYNILENKLFEDQIPYCLENDINVLSYSSLCRGMLSGKYYVGMKFREGDMRNETDPKFQGENFANHIAAVDELKEYAKQFGKTVSELAVRWVLDKGVSCALWGARNPAQLDDIPGVLGWSLTPEQCLEMEAIVAKHVPVQVGKEFLTPPYRED
ncbi:aldo/keto reductase [Bariatricus massiliensis]|uniref:Aldo/keto reductase n=1 Tax=Bariatricus massiliensis TaxID=1745713 RepID=A0ABS8DKS4_9FIRM|nr:aldo/keto reductase [Bariatricus massiliensis]MCB7305902.1 aldo/keto reductase [Bariatricus massiliensis]MCB7376508.1 aldo/keto reductase [Bariatricus massiliensis]MCB7389045.1 aldo/keto reductase [Bariatricus massiliensis]MCB7413218.1 aldo/keto reductase [Bariatricus massiliensis]MCQ5255114.1 aldo/keto reductase [Bariatricus massiliensis]